MAGGVELAGNEVENRKKTTVELGGGDGGILAKTTNGTLGQHKLV